MATLFARRMCTLDERRRARSDCIMTVPTARVPVPTYVIIGILEGRRWLRRIRVRAEHVAAWQLPARHTTSWQALMYNDNIDLRLRDSIARAYPYAEPIQYNPEKNQVSLLFHIVGESWSQ